MAVHNGHDLSLAIDGRERALRGRLVVFSLGDLATKSAESAAGDSESVDADPPKAETIAVVGLGYVGLPTALALRAPLVKIVGFDISAARLTAISAGQVDLPVLELSSLGDAVATGDLRLTADAGALAAADAIIVCVPTPVNQDRTPALAALTAACETVVAQAKVGQTIILTSTSFVGTTRRLLIEPLAARGLTVGVDVHVAFSPERIDPGNHDHRQRETPRVVGGATASCSSAAARVVRHLTDTVYLVSSPEAAEATKLYENIFRAVTLALANEFADACKTLGLDPIEVTLAAGTKPYGFLGAFPGPGVGGHCIPCDPHYLLWQLGDSPDTAPLIRQAMRSIDLRPNRVVERAIEVMWESGVQAAGARILVLGVSYKAGVADLRESSAIPLIAGLRDAGADVRYYDPLLPTVIVDGRLMASAVDPAADSWDLVLVHTIHPEIDYGWVAACPLVLDATYRFDLVPDRHVV